MGTRNLTMVRLDGSLKVAQYGQFDGYLSGAGRDIAKFVQDILVLPSGLALFKEKVAGLTWHTSENLKKAYGEYTKMDKAFPSDDYAWKHYTKKYPELSRDTGNKILSLILSGQVTQVEDQSEFLKDSLFCEWAYEIDLDKDVVKIFRGFQKDDAGEYIPCKIIKEYTFAEYTIETVEKLDKQLSEERE